MEELVNKSESEIGIEGTGTMQRRGKVKKRTKKVQKKRKTNITKKAK